MRDFSKRITIKELDSTEQIYAAQPLISQVYSELTPGVYFNHIDEMIKANDFKMIGAFLDGKLVGVAGYWTLIMLYCGKYLQASNIIVDQNLRGKKIGTTMLRHLEEKARSLNCKRIILDSYVENKKSHSLYFGEDYYIRGFHFMKDL